MADIIRGTEIKFNLNIEPMGDIHMSSYDFEARAYCRGTQQKVVIPKSDFTIVDDDNFTLPIDTNMLGLGILVVDIYAYIPDQDFPDDLRTEISRIETDINIVS